MYLLAVEDVHVDLEDYGSSGLYLTTGNMRSQTRPEDLGQFNIRAGLVNDSEEEKTVTVTATVTGDNAPAPITREITIPAGETVTFDEDCTVENPTLWEGIDYSQGADNSNVGYQYTVTLTIREGDTLLDEVSDKIGFRYFWIDTSADGDSGQGFMLNGEVYPLHGVNRHSFRAGVGSALTEEMHQEDMELMMEMGVNSVRMCHYPHTDYFYDLCDENGIIVWTEIPLVNIPGSAADFQQVTEQQLTELIRQQYNRPSVVFWGLENEIGNGNSLTDPLANAQVAKAKQLLYDLDQLTKQEDPTGRYTTQSLNQVEGRYLRITATGCNQAGYATLYEIEVDGYNLTSDAYTIDHANHRIIVDEIPTGGLAEGAFTGNLNFDGNYTYRVNLSSGWIHEGNTVDILNGGQIEAVYTICTPETADQYPDLNTNLALNHPAYASSKEGTATDGSSTTAASAVDGDASTRWTAFINNGPNGEEDAYYPEWLCVDLGGRVQLNRIDLTLESKGGRTYDYNVYVSTTTAPPSGREEIPDGFTLLYSRTNNTESGQQSTISTSAVARYVLVEITGCSAYSSATPYVGASIYELEVYGTPTLRSVTVESTSGGTAGADASSVPGGTLVTLTATPDQGYYLKEWRVLSGTVIIQNNRFIMPDEDVVIQAVFEEGLSDANIPGDVNRDGIVDVLDVMTLAQIVVGKTSPAEGVTQEIMDLNGDHSVNVLDVMCLAQIAAGRLQ